MSIGQADLDELRDRMARARDQSEGERERRSERDPQRGFAERPPEWLGQKAAAGVGAFGVGYLAGRSGTSSFGATSVPLGLLAAAGAYGVSYMGWAGRYSPYVEAAGDGAFLAWLTVLGAKTGDAAAIRAGEPGLAGGIAGAPAGPGPNAAFAAPGTVQVEREEDYRRERVGCPPEFTGHQSQQNQVGCPPEESRAAPLTEAELHNIAQERMRRNGF